ncbi:MAG: metallophosphoesterase [Patescibacteria group bacterium]|nr:metallophosphoesterase [Patescibacteria group bacterium]
MILIFIFTTQILLFLLHFFLYKSMVRFLGVVNPAYLGALRIILGLLSVSFMAASLAAFRYFNAATRAGYALAAGWLGMVYSLLLASALLWLVFAVTKIFNLPVNFRLFGSVLYGAAIVISVYGFFNAAHPRIKTIEITLPNLPPSWQGKTAVWVSDMHYGQIWNAGTAQKTANAVKNLKPDIVFLGGDFFDGTAANYNQLTEVYNNLGAPWGTYFVPGNHEEFGGDIDNNVYARAIKLTDIKILHNEMVNIEGMQIIGSDFTLVRKDAQLQEMLNNAGLNKSQASILLRHEPSLVGTAAKNNIGLQLSGHTHGGGQVWPLEIFTHMIYGAYDTGLHQLEQTTIYTSTGAGSWGPPVRIGNRPEIVQIKFH